MDKEKITLTIQVFNENNNAFKIFSNENITYNELKQKTIEEFKVSNDKVKFMSFFYTDEEGFKNYINEQDILGNLAEEIKCGNSFLKLNFEINDYNNRASDCFNVAPSENYKNIPIAEENFKNYQKKLEEEKNNSTIIHLKQIIKKKEEKISELENEIKNLNSLKNNDQIFSNVKENEILELKKEIENIGNKFESIINEFVKFSEINKSKNGTDFGNQIQNSDYNFTANDIKINIDELKNYQKLIENIFKNKIDEIKNNLSNNLIDNKQIFENVQESLNLTSKIFENLFGKSEDKIIIKSNENIKSQLIKIEENISKMMSIIEKLNKKNEFYFNNNKTAIDSENYTNENKININYIENSINENKAKDKDKYEKLVHNHSICQKCLKKPIKGIKYECLECNYTLCFDCHNVVIKNGMHLHNFKEIIHFIKKTTQEEINDFLNNFFFENEIIVSKKDISKNNIENFLKFNTKLKKEQNINIKDYLSTYINWEIENFKHKKDCNFEENNIRKNFEKRRKKLTDKLSKAINLIKKFKKNYKLNESDEADEYLNSVLNNYDDDFEMAFNKINEKNK